MAEQMRRKYGQNAVYGSLAYDFNNPELYPEIEYGLPLEKTAPPVRKERTATRVRTGAHARTKQNVAPATVLGVLIAAALFVMSIMAQIQVLDISASTVELQNQLEELEMRQAKLRITYESAFNLAEIEEYAVKELGMQKPSADQIYYIDTSAPDRAVVVNSGANDSFVDRAADFLSGLEAYFDRG